MTGSWTADSAVDGQRENTLGSGDRKATQRACTSAWPCGEAVLVSENDTALRGQHVGANLRVSTTNSRTCYLRQLTACRHGNG